MAKSRGSDKILVVCLLSPVRGYAYDCYSNF